jgi:hypothetical protein
MIEFPCRCGQKFTVPDDQAGKQIQCPNCHWLVDVPRLSELEDLDGDGTFKLQESAVVPEPERIRELRRIYYPGRQDEDGQDIDLRATFEQIQRAGVQETPPGSPDGLVPGAPRYDPETGELIAPMDISPPVAAPQAAIPVSRPLPYAGPDTPPSSGALRALMGPGSIAVMGSVVLMHLALFALFIPMGLGLFFVAPFLLMVAAMIAAHYAIVVEDVGPGAADELPVPLRNLSFGEDIRRPFLNTVFSLGVAYFPAAWVGAAGPGLATWLPLAWGTVFFPVLLLTTCCSGFLVDLAPWKLWKTVRICGWGYLGVVVLWAATLAVYAPALVVSGQMGMQIGSLAGSVPTLRQWMSLPALVVAVFLAHLFCWRLGLLFRRQGHRFPWAFHGDQPARQRARRRRSSRLKYEREPPPRHQASPAPSRLS